MALDRAVIEARHEEMRRITDSGDWTAFADLFAEDGTFVNSVLKEPLRGREAIRQMATAWPKVLNRIEWMAIDGNRLAIGWNERQEQMPAERAPYRGFSTFVFDDEGMIVSYEGMFDTAAVAAAMAP